ncbi:MAG: PD-(D/E)XK nuclease-like domain-containing protein [Methylophilaceae bacterium]
MKSILKKLQEDKHYYGAYGKKYLSNSNIGTLLTNPSDFGRPQEETLSMVQGRYFHVSMLEPHKKDDFVIVDASSRNTNIYKDQSGGGLFLLKKESEALDRAIEAMKGNCSLSSEIFSENARYEVPMIGNFFGVDFKGKADIITEDKIIDIKTSTGIGNFRSKAYAYNYDSQAFIYSSMFGKPFEFFVIDKDTLQMKRFKCSDEFLERGMNKVERAVNVWKRFFGPDATEDVHQYVMEEVL